VAAAIRTAATKLAPGSPVRVASSVPDGWHLILAHDTDEEALLRIPLRAGGTLLGRCQCSAPSPSRGPDERHRGARIPCRSRSGPPRVRAADQRCHPGQDDPDIFAATSFRDPLTNLPSRMLFHDRVEHALHRRSRHVHPVAVMVIDLAVPSRRQGGMGGDAADRLMVQSPSGSSVWFARPIASPASARTSWVPSSTTLTARRTPASSPNGWWVRCARRLCSRAMSRSRSRPTSASRSTPAPRSRRSSCSTRRGRRRRRRGRAGGLRGQPGKAARPRQGTVQALLAGAQGPGLGGVLVDAKSSSLLRGGDPEAPPSEDS